MRSCARCAASPTATCGRWLEARGCICARWPKQADAYAQDEVITAIRTIVLHTWAVVTIGLTALFGGARAVEAGTVSATSQGVTATLRADTHSPRVNARWPIRFTVVRAGHPARASVSYEYLLGAQVVARRSHYTFAGHFSDVFIWPSAAIGYPLTFRAVIVSGGVTIDLDYPVRVLR
jgi:hypothetical protein